MLIIKCEMLKVKHLTLFKPKNWKKVGIFLPRLQEKSNSARFFRNLVSRFSLILTKLLFSIECK